MSGNVLPKPVENKWKISFRWLIQALQRIHRCFQNTSPPWTHKACTVNRLQKTCVQVPDKSHYRRSAVLGLHLLQEQEMLPAKDKKKGAC